MSAPAPVAVSRPYTADSTEGRIMLALRAGTCEGPALEERFGSDYDHVLKKLSAAGLVTSVKADRSRYWSLTPEGRAACPYRNPLLVTAAGTPEPPAPAPRSRSTVTEDPKPMSPTLKESVLKAIRESGPDGTTAADLVARFGQGAYVSISRLVDEGTIFRPRKGHVVCVAFRPQVTLPAITRSDNPRALAAILAPGAAESDLDHESHPESDLESDPESDPEYAAPWAPVPGPFLTAPRITIDDSGAMTLSQPGLGTFTLAPPVVARLGRFLGAFDAPGVPS